MSKTYDILRSLGGGQKMAVSNETKAEINRLLMEDKTFRRTYYNQNTEGHAEAVEHIAKLQHRTPKPGE